MAIIDFESRMRELQEKRGIKSEIEYEMPADEEDWLDDDYGEINMRGFEQEYNYVYELDLELVGSNLKKDALTDEQKACLKKFAKVKEAISRKVLVTGASTLWQLHYVIQQAFGWNDEFLNRFALPEAAFKDMTQDRAKVWGELCGIVFRYPDGDVEDYNWHACDYRTNYNLKLWFREKYSQAEEYGGEGDHYVINQNQVEHLFHEVPYIKGATGDKLQITKATIDELRNGVNFPTDINRLVTRLPIAEVFHLSEYVPKYKKWIKAMRETVTDDQAFDRKEAIKELAMYERRISVGQQLIEKYCDEDGEFKDGVPKALQRELEEEFEKFASAVEMRAMLLEVFNPMVDAFTDSLVYYYGDEWQVRITCKNIYGAALNEAGEFCGFVDYEDNDVVPQYLEKVSKASKENRPICLATDGVNLVENVGGVDGFCEFLEDINTEGGKDYEDAMAFARIAGWKGTKPGPKALL